MAATRLPMPAPVPIAGYSGADPVRAFRGMANAQINGTGATTLGELAYGPAPVAPVRQGPSLTPFRDIAPGPDLNAPPRPTYSAPAPTQTMASVPSPVAATAALAPQLTAPQTPYRDAAPGPVLNAPPVATYSAPKPTQTMASATSPVAATAALAPQLSSAIARGGGAIKGVADAVRTSPASAPVAGMSAGAPSGTMMGSKPTAVSTAPTASSKLDGASAFAGGLSGGTTTREAPSGFMAYSAADPNRALKMMRGF